MSLHGELLVSIHGDRLAEGRVQSVIAKSGAKVERIDRRMAPNGTREHRFNLTFDRHPALEEIVSALGKLEGVALRSVTLLAPSWDPGPTEETTHE